MSQSHKLLAALMSIVMLCGILAGCGSTQPPAATTSTAATEGAAATTTLGSADPDELVKGFQELKISVLGHLPTGSRAAVEDKLTPIWRAKTKVIPEVIEKPIDQEWNTWLQMQAAAGTLPDVISVTNGIFEIVENYKILKDAGTLKEIKLADMQKYMPRTAERLEKLGVTMEEWYKANVDASDGKLWYLPCIPTPALNTENHTMRFMQDKLGSPPYFLWFRDDILKTVFPQAKSEAELKQLYVDQGGKLTKEDIMDAPLDSPEAITDYLRKVKALNLKVDNNPVIPGHFTLNNTAGALWWSIGICFSGFWYTDSGDTAYDAKRGLYSEMTLAPEWKDWIQFNNLNFNEGNFGQEMFIQKDEQKTAKMINGEYAVMNWWAPIADARNKAKEAGRTYGWRLYPIFDIGLKTKYQDVSEYPYPVQNAWGAKSFNPKTVTDEMMPQLLNWLDWNYSMEASELRAWGSPEFYTGDGDARRFKPEYKAVEDYMLTGKQDAEGKDGIYYGIINTALNDRQVWNHEVYGIAEAAEYVYPYSPIFVYPENKESVDTFTITVRTFKQASMKESKFIKEPALPAEVKAAKAEYDKIRQQRADLAKANADARNTTLIKAITDKPGNFEANYKAYMDLFTEPERDLLKKEGEAWLNYYKLKMATWIYLD